MLFENTHQTHPYYFSLLLFPLSFFSHFFFFLSFSVLFVWLSPPFFASFVLLFFLSSLLLHLSFSLSFFLLHCSFFSVVVVFVSLAGGLVGWLIFGCGFFGFWIWWLIGFWPWVCVIHGIVWWFLAVDCTWWQSMAVCWNDNLKLIKWFFVIK